MQNYLMLEDGEDLREQAEILLHGHQYQEQLGGFVFGC